MSLEVTQNQHTVSRNNVTCYRNLAEMFFTDRNFHHVFTENAICNNDRVLPLLQNQNHARWQL